MGASKKKRGKKTGKEWAKAHCAQGMQAADGSAPGRSEQERWCASKAAATSAPGKKPAAAKAAAAKTAAATAAPGAPGYLTRSDLPLRRARALQARLAGRCRSRRRHRLDPQRRGDAARDGGGTRLRAGAHVAGAARRPAAPASGRGASTPPRAPPPSPSTPPPPTRWCAASRTSCAAAASTPSARTPTASRSSSRSRRRRARRCRSSPAARAARPRARAERARRPGRARALHRARQRAARRQPAGARPLLGADLAAQAHNELVAHVLEASSSPAFARPASGKKGAGGGGRVEARFLWLLPIRFNYTATTCVQVTRRQHALVTLNTRWQRSSRVVGSESSVGRSRISNVPHFSRHDAEVEGAADDASQPRRCGLRKPRSCASADPFHATSPAADLHSGRPPRSPTASNAFRRMHNRRRQRRRSR